MRIIIRCVMLVMLFSVSGCISYSLVAAGPIAVGGLQLDPGATWNLAAPQLTPSMRKGGQVWTKDGLLLDRLMIIQAVPDGQPIFKDSTGTAALPVFRASMLPNEIEELTENSIVKLFGEGQVAVSTSNLRPHRFGDDRGVLFNFNVSVSDAPDYRGLAGAFIANGEFYLMMYIAADPHYYDKHLAEVEALITGARLAGAA